MAEHLEDAVWSQPAELLGRLRRCEEIPHFLFNLVSRSLVEFGVVGWRRTAMAIVDLQGAQLVLQRSPLGSDAALLQESGQVRRRAVSPRLFKAQTDRVDALNR